MEKAILFELFDKLKKDIGNNFFKEIYCTDYYIVLSFTELPYKLKIIVKIFNGGEQILYTCYPYTKSSDIARYIKKSNIYPKTFKTYSEMIFDIKISLQTGQFGKRTKCVDYNCSIRHHNLWSIKELYECAKSKYYLEDK